MTAATVPRMIGIVASASPSRGEDLGNPFGRNVQAGSPLHRVIARCYEQALQTVGLTQPQMEVLTSLISAAGPVRPTALAGTLMLERSTVSRNLALMQDRGWVAVAETSATGRAMAVTITDAGLVAFTGASTAWRRAQTDAARMLGPDAAPILDQWLGLDAATPASGSD
jgi:DNA-binding MarR family transcriptional regulator